MYMLSVTSAFRVMHPGYRSELLLSIIRLLVSSVVNLTEMPPFSPLACSACFEVWASLPHVLTMVLR